jgi:hypothetical protein
MSGLVQAERTATRLGDFSEKRGCGNSIDIVLDEQETDLPNEGIEVFIGILREVKHWFVHEGFCSSVSATS